MNEIGIRQNEEPQIELLRARRELYHRATQLLKAQIAVTVVLPVIAAFAAMLLPALRPIVAVAAVAAVLIDVIFLDRPQKKLIKTSAKLAEQFDCAVLDLPWNRFAVGEPVPPEDVDVAAKAYMRRVGSDDELVDWYPNRMGFAPLHAARIVCQRTNIWYDQNVRRKTGATILGSALSVILLLVLAGLLAELFFADFVLVVLAPSTPLLTWAVREYLRQSDTAEHLDQIRRPVDALWERLRQRACSDDDCLAGSREFQGAIYEHRARSPMPLPGVYKRMRPSLEGTMNEIALRRLADLGYQPPADGDARI